MISRSSTGNLRRLARGFPKACAWQGHGTWAYVGVPTHEKVAASAAQKPSDVVCLWCGSHEETCVSNLPGRYCIASVMQRGMNDENRNQNFHYSAAAGE